MTRTQRRQSAFQAMTDLGVSTSTLDRDRRLRVASSILGRPVASFNDLTDDDAGALLRAVEGMRSWDSEDVEEQVRIWGRTGEEARAAADPWGEVA